MLIPVVCNSYRHGASDETECIDFLHCSSMELALDSFAAVGCTVLADGRYRSELLNPRGRLNPVVTNINIGSEKVLFF